MLRGTGLHVGLSGTDAGVNYRLYFGSSAIGAPVAGTGAAMDLGNYTAAGIYTVSATNATTGCVSDMAGNATIVVNPLPAVYLVMGGGNYCAGGAGQHIRLSWSQTGVIYILYNGTAAVGSPVAGTGFLLDFGLQTAPGNYTVVAMNATTLCTRNMAGSATITVDPLPHVFSVTGGGSYCADGMGVHVGLDSSETGIAYMLYNGTTISGSALTGTGSALDFGLKTAAGTYTVVAVNSTTTCLNEMAGAANVVVNPLPTVYSVTGGGSYCSGSTGVHIGLSGSNTGISYQVYKGAATIGSPVAGTGASLDLGAQTLAGIYTVVATNSTTMCAKNMTGSASMAINPLPAVFNVTGGGHYCTSGTVGSSISPGEAGSTAIHVGLDGSEGGMIYLLSNGTTTIGSPIAGTGGAIDFGVQYTSGTYSVLAINSVTLCTRNMTGTAAITIHAIVIPTLSIGGVAAHTSCEGRIDTFTALTTNAGTAPDYIWKVNGAVVGTAAAYTYVPADGDTVNVQMTSNALCAIPAIVNDEIVMDVIAPIIPSITLSADPGTHISAGQTVTFIAHVTNGGTAPKYQWYKDGSAITGATSTAYTTSSLADGDTISCTVIRNDACAMSSFNAVTITVGVGLPAITSADNTIAVLPNPSNGTFVVKGNIGTMDNAAVTLTITNLLGQTVYNRNVSAKDGVINESVNLGAVAPGMYMLNVQSANNNSVLHIVVE